MIFKKQKITFKKITRCETPKGWQYISVYIDRHCVGAIKRPIGRTGVHAWCANKNLAHYIGDIENKNTYAFGADAAKQNVCYYIHHHERKPIFIEHGHGEYEVWIGSVCIARVFKSYNKKDMHTIRPYNNPNEHSELNGFIGTFDQVKNVIHKLVNKDLLVASIDNKGS